MLWDFSFFFTLCPEGLLVHRPPPLLRSLKRNPFGGALVHANDSDVAQICQCVTVSQQDAREGAAWIKAS